MKLPNAHLALVEPEKINGYLLNAAHRYGKSKARFFFSFGFDADSLRAALREHGQRHDFARTKETPFGPRYEVEGDLPSPRWPRAASPLRLTDGHRRDCATPDYRLSSPRLNIREHDCVVLTARLPDENLEAGDVGTVVHVHGEGAGYEVEFMTLTGSTVAVATVLPTQLRPVSQRDVSHVRELSAA